MSSWTLVGDAGPNQTITDGDMVAVVGGTGLTSTTSATDTVTLDLDNTGVTPDSYTYANLTVDQQGRLTAASNGATPAPVGAEYLTLTSNATLTDERTFTPGNGITIVDAGANGTYTVAAPLTNGAGITCTCAGAGTGYSVASQAPWVTVAKTADQNRANNNTVTDDAELLFTCAASSTYAFRLKVFFDTTAAGDFQWKVAYGGTYVVWRMGYEWIVPGTTAKVDGLIIAPTMIALPIVGIGTSGGYLEWDGLVQTTNGGTLSFQWAQNTKTADAGVTVYKGSYLEYQKIV